MFVENLDTVLPRVEPMPIGLNPRESFDRDPDNFIHYMRAMKLFPGFGKLSERNLCVSFQNRINHSAERPMVKRQCMTAWAPFCRNFNERIKNETWDRMVLEVGASVRGEPILKPNWGKVDLHFFDLAHCQFILCVHGGGLDPSPKV